MIERRLRAKVQAWLGRFPAVALLGPRQCGKSTLAKEILGGFPGAVYLDLERPKDRAKLSDAESFFELHAGRLVCLDEIQRTPELFPALRGILDERGKNGQLLLLGSASRELLRQSSETLAGRIGYLELTPFLLSEVAPDPRDALLRRLWLRGGFPRSFLAGSDRDSFEWRQEFIRSFLERDMPQLGIGIPAESLRRFWAMCAHSHGQLWNSSKIGEALGVSHTTARSYLDLLSKTFLLRILPPHEPNLKKRLVRTPKVYLRDTGLLHALLDQASFDELLGHPAYGFSWEGLVIEEVLAAFGSDWRPSFYRTPKGAELDLVLERGRRRVAIECKASQAPGVAKGFWIAMEDLKVERAWVVAPVKEAYPLAKNVSVTPLAELLRSNMGT